MSKQNDGQWHRTKTRSRFRGPWFELVVERRKSGWRAWWNDLSRDDGTVWEADVPTGASRFIAEMAAANVARELATELSTAANEAIRTAKTLPDPLDPKPHFEEDPSGVTNIKPG